MKNKIVKKPDVFQEPILPQSVSLPSSVDWQSQGAVTPIKNQGQCMVLFVYFFNIIY